MTGPLTLSGDPTSSLQAATKQYVDSSIANAKLKYINRFNLQGSQEITILSQDEADKYTLYYFCAFFVSTDDNTSVRYITTDDKTSYLFNYRSSFLNIYNMSIMLNNVNGNSCLVCFSNSREAQIDGDAGKFTGRISTTGVASGSFVDVYVL